MLYEVITISEFKDSKKAKRLFSGIIERMQTDPAFSKHTKRIKVGGNEVFVWKNEAHEFFYFSYNFV